MKNKLLELLKKYWWVGFLAVVSGLVGWYMKPSVVETIETVKTVEVIQKDSRLDELMNSFEQLNRDYQEMKESKWNERFHQETVETRSPDGTIVVKNTIDKNIESVVQETRKEVEVRVVEVEKQVVVTEQVVVTKTETVEKIVRSQLAQWKVGLMAGINPALLPAPKVESWLVGGEIERRLAGPIWLGLWGAGTTNGQGLGGIKLSLEF